MISAARQIPDTRVGPPNAFPVPEDSCILPVARCPDFVGGIMFSTAPVTSPKQPAVGIFYTNGIGGN